MKRSTLLLLIALGMIALIYGVWISLKVAPNFAMSLLTIVMIVLLYVLSEQWITHAANEFENRFWSFIAFSLAFVCLFLDDSPIPIGQSYPITSWILAIFAAFFVHNYDRHLRRGKLMRVETLKRSSSSTVLNQTSEKLHETLNNLTKLQEGIDYFWFSSTFLNIFMLPRVLYIESQIISIFTEVSHQELNYIVSNGHMGLLFYKIKDHKFAKKFNRTILLETLAIHRISELNTLSRALLIDGLQRMKLSAHPKSEQYVKNIFLKTFLDDLSDLKNLTDSKGDVNSLHKLIYQDIRDPAIRKSILDHIHHEAGIQKAHMRLNTPHTQKRRGQFAWRKILSDVDDTLSCSGGHYPAGIDTSYPRKVLYPGVLAFYRELDMGATGPETWSADRVGNLVFLSARPHVYQDASEKHSYDMFKTLQANRGLHTSPSLLAGSLDTGTKFIVAGQMEPLAQKKYENFQEYAALYEEYDLIFVGDNGQGDVRAAELVSKDQAITRNMLRAYMHEVQSLHLTHAADESTRSHSCSFIFYFKTYVEAAVDAYEHNLIRLSGLQRVAQEAVADFDKIPWDLFGSKVTPGGEEEGAIFKAGASHRQKNRLTVDSKRNRALKESFRKRYLRLLELNHALTAANVIIEKGGLKAVQLLRFQCLYNRGTPVSTPYGDGVVERFRPFDGTYEVLMQMGLRDNCTGGYRAFLNGDTVRPLDAPLANKRGGKKRSLIGAFFRRADSNNVINTPTLSTPNIERIKRESIRHSASDHSVSSFDGAEGSGFTELIEWVAWTPYGLAKVTAERPKDDMVELTAPWGAKLYLSSKNVVKMKEVVSYVPIPPAIVAAISDKSSTVVNRDNVTASPARGRGYSFSSPFRSILSPDRGVADAPSESHLSNATPDNNSSAGISKSTTAPPVRSSFWLRIFGYGKTITDLPHPIPIDPTATTALTNPESSSYAVCQQDSGLNMANVETFLEDVEVVLQDELRTSTEKRDIATSADESHHTVDVAQTEAMSDNTSPAGTINTTDMNKGDHYMASVHTSNAIEGISVDAPCLQRFKVNTSYGCGTLLVLMDRGESIILKVQLIWGAVAYISITSLLSHEIQPTSGSEPQSIIMARDTNGRGTETVDKVTNIRDNLEAMRKLRGRILLSRSRSTSADECDAEASSATITIVPSCGTTTPQNSAECVDNVKVSYEGGCSRDETPCDEFIQISSHCKSSEVHKSAMPLHLSNHEDHIVDLSPPPHSGSETLDYRKGGNETESTAGVSVLDVERSSLPSLSVVSLNVTSSFDPPNAVNSSAIIGDMHGSG